MVSLSSLHKHLHVTHMCVNMHTHRNTCMRKKKKEEEKKERKKSKSTTSAWGLGPGEEGDISNVFMKTPKKK